ncbi:MAG: PorV/PorQ family protein [candidate division WOR-3 bacterium]
MRRLLILLLFTPLYAQMSKAGQSGAKFLSLPYNVRSEAMGGTGVSLVDNGSVFVNPSSLASINFRNVYASVGSLWGFTNFAIAYNVPTKRGNLSFFTSGVYVGGMEGYEIDINGNITPIGSISYLATQLGFLYARFFTDKFSFGIGPKIIYEGYGGFSNAYSIALDVGTYYITGFRDMVLAASVRNFGFDMKPSGTYTRYIYDATLVETTATYTAYRLPAIYSIGFSLSILRSAYGSLLMAFQLDHPIDNLESYNLGFEYNLLNIVFIRTGYKFYANPDEAVAGANGINFGIGVKYGRFGLDYGFYNKGILPPINQLGLYYSF